MKSDESRLNFLTKARDIQFFSEHPRPSLESAQPPPIPWALSGLKQQRDRMHHSSPSHAKVNNVWSHAVTPSYAVASCSSEMLPYVCVNLTPNDILHGNLQNILLSSMFFSCGPNNLFAPSPQSLAQKKRTYLQFITSLGDTVLIKKMACSHFASQPLK